MTTNKTKRERKADAQALREERFTELGKQIWEHVYELTAIHLVATHGTTLMAAEARKRLVAAERVIWGDMQTLFRGGVFEDELKFDGED